MLQTMYLFVLQVEVERLSGCERNTQKNDACYKHYSRLSVGTMIGHETQASSGVIDNMTSQVDSKQDEHKRFPIKHPRACIHGHAVMLPLKLRIFLCCFIVMTSENKKLHSRTCDNMKRSTFIVIITSFLYQRHVRLPSHHFRPQSIE